MQQKVLEHAGNSNRHGAAALAGSSLLFCTAHQRGRGGQHAVDIIPDIGNIMHNTMRQ